MLGGETIEAPPPEVNRHGTTTSAVKMTEVLAHAPTHRSLPSILVQTREGFGTTGIEREHHNTWGGTANVNRRGEKELQLVLALPRSGRQPTEPL